MLFLFVSITFARLSSLSRARARSCVCGLYLMSKLRTRLCEGFVETVVKEGEGEKTGPSLSLLFDQEPRSNREKTYMHG